MKRLFAVALTLFCVLAFNSSCEKAPFVTMTGPRSYTFTREGGTQTFAFSCNRDWNVSSSESWIRISPSSGTASDGDISVTITCSPNTTYDPRNTTITISAEGITESIEISQETNYGLMSTPTKFEISNEEQTISIKVQTNTQYTVVIEDDAKDWISQASTKGLTESTVNLIINKNEKNERVGHVNLMSPEASETIIVTQESGDIVFHDKNFESYCLANFDTNQNGKLSFTEANTVESIMCYDMNIENLEDIKYFSNLVELSCGNNLFTVLDVSENKHLKNLVNIGGPLTTLNVQGCDELEMLMCNDTQIQEYNLKDCLNLKSVFGNLCPKLNSIDLSGCSSLTTVICYSSPIQEINLEGCSSLTSLSCTENQLTSLDLSDCISLKILQCYNNQLTNINLKNCSRLEDLNCSNNLLSNLDITDCDQLVKLNCNYNKLQSLELSKFFPIESLNCESNLLTTLDLSNCPNLHKLNCGRNQITTLNIENCPHITDLACFYNQLTSLVFSKDENTLTYLNCSYNKLTSLELKDHEKLIQVYCSHNQIKEINLKGSPELEIAEIEGNSITDIDFSQNPKLKNVICGSNPISSINVNNCKSLETLSCEFGPLTSIDIKDCTELTYLKLSFQKLTSLDVSNNLKLETLKITGNTELTTLWMKTGQTIPNLDYWSFITSIQYR